MANIHGLPVQVGDEMCSVRAIERHLGATLMLLREFIADPEELKEWYDPTHRINITNAVDDWHFSELGASPSGYWNDNIPGYVLDEDSFAIFCRWLRYVPTPVVIVSM